MGRTVAELETGLSSRELAEWRILAQFDRDIQRMVSDKVPVEVAAEIVLSAHEERGDDGGTV